MSRLFYDEEEIAIARLYVEDTLAESPPKWERDASWQWFHYCVTARSKRPMDGVRAPVPVIKIIQTLANSDMPRAAKKRLDEAVESASGLTTFTLTAHP